MMWSGAALQLLAVHHVRTFDGAKPQVTPAEMP